MLPMPFWYVSELVVLLSVAVRTRGSSLDILGSPGEDIWLRSEMVSMLWYAQGHLRFTCWSQLWNWDSGISRMVSPHLCAFSCRFFFYFSFWSLIRLSNLWPETPMFFRLWKEEDRRIPAVVLGGREISGWAHYPQAVSLPYFYYKTPTRSPQRLRGLPEATKRSKNLPLASVSFFFALCF